LYYEFAETAISEVSGKLRHRH